MKVIMQSKMKKNIDKLAVRYFEINFQTLFFKHYKMLPNFKQKN